MQKSAGTTAYLKDMFCFRQIKHVDQSIVKGSSGRVSSSKGWSELAPYFLFLFSFASMAMSMTVPVPVIVHTRYQEKIYIDYSFIHKCNRSH